MPRPFRLTVPKPMEHDIQGDILTYLSWHPFVAWAERFNTGAHVITDTDAKGKQTRRFIRYAFPGCSDILGQLKDGRFLAIEVKRHKQQPTPDQRAFLAQVATHNGVSFIARSIEDVEHHLALATTTTTTTATR